MKKCNIRRKAERNAKRFLKKKQSKHNKKVKKSMKPWTRSSKAILKFVGWLFLIFLDFNIWLIIIPTKHLKIKFMQKKICVTGTIQVPSDIVSLVLNGNSAEFKRTPNYEFHKGDDCYATKACLSCEGKDYLVTQQLGESSLKIGYIEEEPDKPTQRKIKKIISEKFFWENETQVNEKSWF